MGDGRGKDKPHHPLMISVQKVRIGHGKGKRKSDGWSPHPSPTTPAGSALTTPKPSSPCTPFAPQRNGSVSIGMGSALPTLVNSGQGVILFPFGATPPLIGEAEEMVPAKPMGAFNRDPNDLVVTTGDRLVVNHLLEHAFLSYVQPDSLLDDLDRVPLSEKAAILNENPPILGRPQDSRTRCIVYGNYGGRNHCKHNPHKVHDLPVLKRVAERVLETAKKSVVGGGGWVELHHS